MHDQRTPAMEEDGDDATVLALLLADDSRWPWADEEVAREVGDPVASADSLARLHGVGLVHRLDGFVFPTRAAQHAARVEA